MNAIVSFRLCKLSDGELMAKIDAATDEMFETQKVPTRHIPAMPDDDYDLLVGELLKRYQEKIDGFDAAEVKPPLIEGEDNSLPVLAEVEGNIRLMCYSWINGGEDNSGYAWCNCYGDFDGYTADFDDDYKVTRWWPLPIVKPENNDKKANT